MEEIKKCILTQGFGENLSPLYASAGQTGHTGIDEMCGYGTPVFALKKGLVYKILDDKRPAKDGSGYWGVFIISEDGGLCEWQVGHLSKILCEVGDIVEAWTVIGLEGNKGGVYSGGVQITKEMQDAGDTRGSHRHWNKKLLKKKTLQEMDNEGGQYLTAYNESFNEIFQDKDGFCYQIQDFRNGYNGSVNPAKDLVDGFEAAKNKPVIEAQEPEIIPTPEKEEDKVTVIPLKHPNLYELFIKIIKRLLYFLRPK